jgi:hypothetical protein
MRAARPLPLLLLALLTACAGHPVRAAKPAGPGPIHLRVKSLPSQGLFLQEGRSVLLVGLDGHRYLKLRNYWIDGPDWLKPAVFDRAVNLSERLDDSWMGSYRGFAVLGNRRGQMYRLDPERRELIPVNLRHIPLPGGAVLVERMRDEDILFTITSKKLRLKMTGSTFHDTEIHVVDGKVAVDGTNAVDLETGEHWKIAADCEVAGEYNGTLYALCGRYVSRSRGYAMYLVAYSRHGTRRHSVDLGGAPGIAWLSPNGRYAATMGAASCGPAPSELIVVKTGEVRPLKAGPKWTTGAIFGWTSDSRLVATVSTDFSECGSDDNPPIVVINPATLAHRYVLRDRDDWIYMWGTLENPS